jgi:hypothetical protein
MVASKLIIAAVVMSVNIILVWVCMVCIEISYRIYVDAIVICISIVIIVGIVVNKPVSTVSTIIIPGFHIV